MGGLFFCFSFGQKAHFCPDRSVRRKLTKNFCISPPKQPLYPQWPIEGKFAKKISVILRQNGTLIRSVSLKRKFFRNFRQNRILLTKCQLWGQKNFSKALYKTPWFSAYGKEMKIFSPMGVYFRLCRDLPVREENFRIFFPNGLLVRSGSVEGVAISPCK